MIVKKLILQGMVRINNETSYEPSKKIHLKDNLIIKNPKPKKTNIAPYNYNLDINRNI